MKTKIILISSVVMALVVGFGAGYFQASHSWKNKLYDDFYTGSGADAFVVAGALKDLHGGDQTAGINSLEKYLELNLARLEPLPAQQRTGVVIAGIRKAKNYRLEFPWEGSTPPAIKQAADEVLASAK